MTVRVTGLLLLALAPLTADAAESRAISSYCSAHAFSARDVGETRAMVLLRDKDVVATGSTIGLEIRTQQRSHSSPASPLGGQIVLETTEGVHRQPWRTTTAGPVQATITVPDGAAGPAELRVTCDGGVGKATEIMMLALSTTVPFASAAPSPSGETVVALLPDASTLDQVFANSRTETTRGPREAAIYRQFASAVPLITTRGQSIGSGIVIDRERGWILTNWHVTESNRRVAVHFKPPVRGDAVDDDDAHIGEVIAEDATRDLALVRVENIPEHVAELPVASMNALEVGEDVHAIGHPAGLVWTYTRGIVSQIRDDFEWTYEGGSRHRATVIQTQTPINPGNSGGPLIVGDGEVIGINSFGAGGGMQGLNQAVAANEITDFLANIEDFTLPVDGASQGRTRPVRPGETDRDQKSPPERRPRPGKPEPETGHDDGAIGEFDRDGDGRADIRADDRNGDGRADYWVIDNDGDGQPDVVAIDVNGDGDPDVVKRIRG